MDLAQNALADAEAALNAVTAREGELTRAIDEVTVVEDMDTVEQAVTTYETERAAAETAVSKARENVAAIAAELRAAEEKSASPAPVMARKNEGGRTMQGVTVTDNSAPETRAVRRFFGGMDRAARAAMLAQEDVRTWLDTTRTMMQARAVSNVGLTIPDIMLGLLRANLEGYSKLLKHTRLRSVRGDARQLISTVPEEAVWTDCCANLNEQNMTFYQEEFNCYKVGGYFAVCNANLEDSDLNLAAEILQSLAESIGLALDKAILFGRNTSAALKMPQGIISRLTQTEAPAGYPATARPWADLHTKNIKSIASTVTGTDLFAEIVRAAGAAKNQYGSGGRFWAMNETTRTELIAASVSFNASGAVVAGFGNTMPVMGGAIETLEFLPDNVIVTGFDELYTLIERAGQKFASSEHVRFLQDQTVFKGTARYDGGPSIAEGFAAIGINSVTPTATMNFAPDTAN